MLKQLLYIIIVFVFTSGYAQINTFQKTYGILGYNAGVAVVPIANNNFIIAGNMKGYNGNTDIYLAQIDSNGTLIWDKALGSNQIDFATNMIMGYDSTLLLTGYTDNTPNGEYDVLCMAIDLKGTTKWTKQYGTTEWDFANKITPSITDSSYVIVGKTYGNTAGGSDMYIIKINQTGDTIWTKTVGFTGNDAAYDAAILPNKTIAVVGSTDELAKDTVDASITLLSMSGNFIWNKTYGNKLNNEFKKCILTNDNNIIAVGNTESLTADEHNAILTKTDMAGNIAWSQEFSFCYNMIDMIQFDTDSIAIACTTNKYGGGQEDMFLLSIHKNGQYRRGNSFGGLLDDTPSNFALTSSNTFVMCGTTNSWGIGHTNIYIAKTNHLFYFNITPPRHIVGINNPDASNSFKITPNPAKDLMRITSNENTQLNEIKIIDLLGNFVFEKKIVENKNTLTIDISNFANGFYTIVFISNNAIETSKLIIQK